MNMQYDIEPRRALHTDFTERTLRRSITTKRHLSRKHRLRGIFTMNITKFVKHPMAAAFAVVVIGASTAGVYAATNWFNGDVSLRNDGSVLSVDLSGCKGALPPGVDSSDRSKVQFKVLGQTNINAAALQQKMLAGCEFDAVVAFYRELGQSPQPSTIKAVDPGKRTAVLDYHWGREFRTKTFTFAENATVYNLGQPGQLTDLKPGDSAMVVYRGSDQPFIETENPFDTINIVESIFKTQYDINQAPHSIKAFYEQNNIMPLDQYNKINTN